MELDLLTILLWIGWLALGLVIAYLWGRSALSREQERTANLSEQLERRESELSENRSSLSAKEQELASLSANHRNLQQRLEEQKKEIEERHVQMKKDFELLANKILEDKSKKFTEQNREKLGELLKPLGTKIKEFREKVESYQEKTEKGQSALHQHLKLLQENNRKISEDAQNLTRALKGDSQRQGAWGEIVLERVLEMSGLQKGREYEVQESHTLQDGRRSRPDVVVHLPDDKRVVIDAKVSLTAYERFVKADEDDERARAVRDHLTSVRGHVKGLGAKNYQNLYGGASPDFVLLFIPIEPAFGLAAAHDTALYADAFDEGIVIVSPSTLLATLKTIESIWKREYQNRNALEIADRGGKLYDKFTGFVESMESIGNRLRQAQESYDTAMTRLSKGSGHLVGQVEKLKKLGAKATKQLPSELLGPAAGEEKRSLEKEETSE